MWSPPVSSLRGKGVPAPPAASRKGYQAPWAFGPTMAKHLHGRGSSMLPTSHHVVPVGLGRRLPQSPWLRPAVAETPQGT